MTRKELAEKMYQILKKTTNLKDIPIWKAIAETDDKSLLAEYEKQKEKIC